VSASPPSEVGELYRLLGKRLYGTALRLLGRPEEAEDAVHEAFLSLCRQPAGFVPDQAGGWLHRVLVNRCLDRLRGRARWREGPELESVAIHLPPSGDQRLDLERAVAGLPEGARRVFVLHDVEGFRHHEVAGLLGISEGTSKSQLFRARELLRRALEAPEGSR
jgi:RNA polymerase sigma-70 factor (ECF subfamily)